MADGFSVEIIEQPKGSLGLLSEGTLGKKIFEVVKVAMDHIGAHAAERAQANAPIDTGDLRRSIRHKTKVVGPIVTAKVIAGEPYALRMHEELTPAGRLQLGPTSRSQPGTPEGGVGGKYIERVVNFHAATYQKFLGDSLKSNLSKTQSRKVSVKRITEGSS